MLFDRYPKLKNQIRCIGEYTTLYKDIEKGYYKKKLNIIENLGRVGKLYFCIFQNFYKISIICLYTAILTLPLNRGCLDSLPARPNFQVNLYEISILE